MHAKWTMDANEDGGLDLTYVDLHTGHTVLSASFIKSDQDLVSEVVCQESFGLGDLIVYNGTVTGFIMPATHDDASLTNIPLDLEAAFVLEG